MTRKSAVLLVQVMKKNFFLLGFVQILAKKVGNRVAFNLHQDMGFTAVIFRNLIIPDRHAAAIFCTSCNTYRSRCMKRNGYRLMYTIQ